MKIKSIILSFTVFYLLTAVIPSLSHAQKRASATMQVKVQVVKGRTATTFVSKDINLERDSTHVGTIELPHTAEGEYMISFQNSIALSNQTEENVYMDMEIRREEVPGKSLRRYKMMGQVRRFREISGTYRGTMRAQIEYF